jgi:hypothetical protein
VLNKKKYTNKLVYSNYSIYEYEDKFVYYFKNNNDEILKLNLNDKILQNVKIDNKTYNNINSIDKLLKKLLKKEIAFSFIIKK